MFALIKGLAWLPLTIVYPTKIKNKKNIPEGKAILAMNHTSSMDTPLLLAHTKGKKYILAKKELFKNKFKASILKACGAFPVDRDNGDINALKNSLKVLKAGKKLVIFPEGTRNKGDISKMLPIKNGVAVIAIKSQTPIVPIRVCNRPRAFRKTTIVIGEPFELSQFYGKKLTDEILEEAKAIISQKINELK